MVDKWIRQRSESINSYKIFKTRKDISRSPLSGSEHEFYVIESDDWVNVVAITENEEVVLINQYRHGIMDITLEIPGGMVGKDESPLDCAMRELREETGYASSNWIELGVVNPNPAILNNKCYSFLALNAIKSHFQDLEGTEDIEVIKRPISMIDHLIKNGWITHSLVICAFCLYDQYKKSV